MINRAGNVCIRCGKERIFIKTWKEKIGINMVTYTQTSCPDEECQSLVDKDLKARADKKALLKSSGFSMASRNTKKTV